MYTLRILIVILSITIYPLSTMFAQINVYTQGCNSITPAQYDSGNTFSAGCYELPSTSGQVYNTTVQKEVVAEDYILLEEDVEFTASGSGQADLRIEPSPFDVVAYVPNLNSVPKLSKFELGLKPTQNIIDQIQNFLNETGSNELNPFMSDDIYIRATFRNEQMEWVFDNPLPTYELVQSTKYRDGFFTKDVERDISGFEDFYDHPYLQPGGGKYWDDGGWYEGHPDSIKYQELGGGWTESFSEYPFRIRFAPPKTGVWECNITIDINQGNETFSLPTFSFEVVDSNNKGYLSVDNNNRFFKREGKSFMPLGLNYSWPGGNVERNWPLFTPNGNELGANMMSASQIYSVTPPIAVYESYLRKMDTIADYGANYFRMIMCPWALDIEYEKLGDYSDRMHIASEMDLILERAKENDMMIHWNLMIHYVFQDFPYGIDHWDWTQDQTDGSDLYCYRSDPQLQLDEEIEWFTNTLSKKYYKERLRYIVARWGYSPAIAAFEHFSEIDQIGGSGDGDDPEAPYIVNDQQIEIANWHEEMSNYLKNTLHVEQIISPSYTKAVDDPFSDEGVGNNQDFTYSIENSIDMVNYNGYDFGVGVGPEGTPNFPIDFDYFRNFNRNRPLYDVMNFETINDKSGRGEYKKPVMYSESGPLNVWGCDRGIETTRGIYKALFSGLAGYIEWELQVKKYYFDFRSLAAFFKNVDLEGRDFHPGFTDLNQGEWIVNESYIESSSPIRNSVDLIYLRSKDKNSALGAITNRTYNYLTKGGCLGSNTDDFIFSTTPNNVPFQGVPLYADMESNLLNRVSLRNMNSGNYDITYYSYKTPNSIISTSSNFGPIVGLDYPTLNEENWIVLFKAEKRNPKGNNQKNTNLESRIKQAKSDITIFPNPTNEYVFIESGRKIIEIRVLDATGREVTAKAYNAQRITMDFQNIEIGVYYLNIYFTEGDFITRKVIKK